MAKGVWVTVFAKDKVLYSLASVDRLVDYCVQNGLDEIYMQIYRAGEAFYDTKFLPRDQYEKMLKAAGQDPVDYLIKRAGEKKIRVYAWVNILSLAQNRKAPIVQKHSSEVLTRDKQGRASIRTDGVDHSDTFYLRDDQIFLEPGDPRVVDWTLSVINDILSRYPGFAGLHLDYIRYPYAVPFIPDSRFTEFGVSYGYGERNVERFKTAHGLDPIKGDYYYKGLHLKWDAWKREQVTDIVQRIRDVVREKAPAWQISAAVVPTQERAYSIAYQDWPLWLEKKLVDYVVLMNYIKDERQNLDTLKGAMAFKGPGKIYNGFGNFLFKDREQIKRLDQALQALKPDGMVYFSYDDLVEETRNK